jgi:hypothetical protein
MYAFQRHIRAPRRRIPRGKAEERNVLASSSDHGIGAKAAPHPHRVKSLLDVEFRWKRVTPQGAPGNTELRFLGAERRGRLRAIASVDV